MNIMKSFKKSLGFTLIEMMIAVAIIGILATIAVPSYEKYSEKTHLASAKSVIANLYQTLANEKLHNPKNMVSQQNIENFVKQKMGAIPDENKERYVFTHVANTNGKIVNIFMQAAPRRTGWKFYLWVDNNGNVYKCESSGSVPAISATKPNKCTTF